MFEVLTGLFDPTGFPPRKECGTGWTPALIWLHVTSDLFIWLAYLSIPLVLLYFTRRRDLPYPRLFALFALFILACGFTHLIEALIFEYPIYRFAGVMKLVTAVVSWATVIALVPVVPRVMSAVSLAAQPGAITKEHRALPAGEWLKPARARAYTVAILAGVLSVLVRAALDPLVGGSPVYVVPLLAVVYVSWQHGFGPGVACLVIGLVGYAAFFVLPRGELFGHGLGVQLITALFFFCGVACAALGEGQHLAQRRARVALATAVARGEELESEIARRRVVEAALRQREADLVAAQRQTADALARLNAFLDNAPLGIAFFDPELRYERINTHLAAANGKPAEAHTGRTLLEMVPDFPPETAAAYRRTAGPDGTPYTAQIRRPDVRMPGAARTWQVTAFPVRDAAGTNLGAGVIAQDITDRLQAEQELRESEARLRTFYDHSPLYMGIVEPREGDILHVYDNRASCAFFGVGPDRTAGRRASELGAPPEVVGVWLEKYRESARRGAAVHFEYQYDAPDGPRWLSAVVSPLETGGSRPRFCYVAQDVTERRRAADELRASEARFRQLADAMPQIVWVTRPDGYHEYYNRQWYEYTGQTFEQTHGEGWNQAFHPDDRARAWERWRHSLATGEPYQIEYRCRRADGAYRWFLGRALPQRDAAGRVVCWYGTCTDIDDQKRAEEELRESEGRFRSLADGAPALIWVAEPDGRRTYFNRTWVEFTGRPAEQQLGGGWAASIHPEDRDRYLGAYAAAIDGRRAFELEYRLRRRDGAYRWVLARGTPRLTRSGSFAGFVGLCLDVTDRREAAEAVRVSEERYRLLTEAVPHIVWNADPAGEVTYLNQRWLDFTALPLAAAAGGGWLGAVHPDDRDRVAAAWRETVGRLAPGAADQFQHELRLRDGRTGEYRWFLTVAVPLRRADGAVDQWIGSMADVHSQKTAAERVAEANRFLEATTDALSSHIAVLDPDGVIVKVNAAWRQFGEQNGLAAPFSAVGTNYLDVCETPCPSGAPANLAENIRAVIRGAAPVYQVEYPCHSPTEQRWFLMRVNRFPGAGPVRVVVSHENITPRVLAEQAIRESEAFRKSVFENSPDCLKIIDLDGRVLEMNEGGYRLMEVDDFGALRGAHWAELWPAGNRETVREAIDQARGGGVGRFQGFCPTARGTPKYWDVSVAAVPAADGKPFRLIGVSRDVTEQRRAEERVRESEELFRQLAESVPQLAWMAHPNGDIFWYNRRWYEYTGTTFEQMQGWGWQSVHDPDELPRVLERWKGSLAAGEPFNMVFPLRGADGTFRPFLTLVAPFRDATGAVVRWFGTNTDISAQRALEHSLRASEQRFRTLTETVPQMVWTADPRGEVTFFNRRWDEYTGLTLEQGRETNWAGGPVHPDDAPALHAGWQLAVAGGANSFSHEFRLRRAADGGYRWMLSVAVPLRDPTGAVAEWVGTLTDIDDQKQQAQTLERMVRERTQALEETNLVLTGEVAERKAVEERVRAVASELERSNGELEKFAYVASHDLQEPLRKIQAFGDRLRNKCRDALPDNGKEYVDRMLSAAGRMRRLIDDLLTFSRVTTQRKPYKRLDLDQLVREVVSDLDVRIGQANGTVRVGPLPALDADPSQMRQLFQNLIANAVKFHRPGVPPVVEVVGEVVDQPPADPFDGEPVPMARITVRDNGIGFDEKYRDRIFEVFQRLHGRDEFEGTGVGLAICRKIVERHGGTIAAHSRPGEGATFVVTMPARQPIPREVPSDDDDQPEQTDYHSDGRR